MAKSILQKHYLRILTHWPTDLLRPEVSFQTAMRRRIDARLAPTTTTTTTTPPEANIVSNGAQVSIPTAVAFDEKGELEQVNVLYSFLEDRYAKRYPLSEKMTRPASKPDYYDGLLKELDEAPRRSWFQSVVNRWKGALRFS